MSKSNTTETDAVSGCQPGAPILRRQSAPAGSRHALLILVRLAQRPP